MEFQWYPGHMKKAINTMQADIKLIDVIVELIDARVPFSSKNPDIEKLSPGKSRIIIFNKSDLADEKVSALWKKYYEDKGYYVKELNSKSGKGIKDVLNLINEACSEKLLRNKKRGIKNRPLRALVAGIPNVGKSTFINTLTRTSKAKTGNKPGVTKGKQWISLGKNIELLDTPGVLWPKFEDMEVGKKLAFIGSIKDELFNVYELCVLLVDYLKENYSDVVPEKYGIDESTDSHKIIENFAINRGLKMKGDTPDVDKAAVILVDEFRKGKMGKISLEKPSVE
ncbi:MAG: ribosome biogenesis GTPase YlqF [Lachnospiraceae bacterium]|nr:ribosome biogenesis GTPase YlqF [Lachnospiraceae bacterium]